VPYLQLLQTPVIAVEVQTVKGSVSLWY